MYPSARVLLGELGIGVVKNSGLLIYGGGKTLIGVVTENDELLESGIKTTGKGAKGLGLAVLNKFVRNKFGGDDSDTEDTDLDL